MLHNGSFISPVCAIVLPRQAFRPNAIRHKRRIPDHHRPMHPNRKTEPNYPASASHHSKKMKHDAEANENAPQPCIRFYIHCETVKATTTKTKVCMKNSGRELFFTCFAFGSEIVWHKAIVTSFDLWRFDTLTVATRHTPQLPNVKRFSSSS